jgi:hypothetical protein
MSAALARALSRTSLRVRTARALTAACRALFVLALTVGAGELLYQPPRAPVLLAIAALTLAVAALAFLLRVPAAQLARALDQAGGLSGRVVAALELSALPARTPFMEAALRDAESHLGAELPARAAPLSARPLLLALCGLAALLASVSIPRRPPPREPMAKSVAPSPAEAPPSAQAGEPASTRALRASLLALAEVRPGLAEEPIRALRALSEALAAGKLASSERQKLQAALEQARASERARREGEQALLAARAAARAATSEPAPRTLEQLQRPSPERKLEQLQRPEPRPESATSEREQSSQPSANAQGERDQQAVEDYAKNLAQAADALAAHDQEQAARALRGAAAALERHSSSQAAQQQERERSQREQLAGEQHDAAREQFEQAARGLVQQRSAGGGSEPDPGGHAPGERRIGAQYQDQRLRGVHGEGPSRSQVIEGASQGGFASVPYRRVYSEYREHAEAVLERDDVPAGERFYVRRYFELVQPREPDEAP